MNSAFTEMDISAPVQSFKQCLPELRQFAFIMTGDEDVADAVLEAALRAALDCVDNACDFPCHRSWMFAHLLQAVKRSSSDATRDVGLVNWISLLQVPAEARAVFVLTDGFAFDLATTCLITRHSRQEVEHQLTKARAMFHELSTAYVRTDEREHGHQ